MRRDASPGCLRANMLRNKGLTPISNHAVLQLGPGKGITIRGAITMIAPFLPLTFHFAQHSKLQHGDLLSGCGCTLILSEIIQYVIFCVNTLFHIFSLGVLWHETKRLWHLGECITILPNLRSGDRSASLQTTNICVYQEVFVSPGPTSQTDH